MEVANLKNEDDTRIVPTSPLPIRFGIRGELQRRPRSSPIPMDTPSPPSPVPCASTWPRDQAQPLDFSTRKCWSQTNGSPQLPTKMEAQDDHDEALDYSQWLPMNGCARSKAKVPPQSQNMMKLYAGMMGSLSQNYLPYQSVSPLASPVPPAPTTPILLGQLLPEMNSETTPATTSGKGKVVRPFKAYPRDPCNYLSMGISMSSNKTGINYGMSEVEAILVHQSNNDYMGFREKMLNTTLTSRTKQRQSPPSTSATSSTVTTTTVTSSQAAAEGGTSIASEEMSSMGPTSPTSSTSSNGIHKKRSRNLPDELKDEAYWERRRKNNEAAKRSRDARRAKEDEIAIRCAYLEQENVRLRVELAAARSEITKLRCILFNS